MLPGETKPTVLPKEGKINTTSTNCGGHSDITKQTKANGSKNSYKQHVCTFARRSGFQHEKSFRITHCILRRTMKKLKWHAWSARSILAHWNKPSTNRYWNLTQHKTKLPPFSFTFFIKFHLKVSCPMT